MSQDLAAPGHDAFVTGPDYWRPFNSRPKAEILFCGNNSPLIFKLNLHKTIFKGSWDIKEYIERVRKHWSFLCWGWDLKCKHVLPHPSLSCRRRTPKKKAGHLSSPPHIFLVWSDDPRDSDTGSGGCDHSPTHSCSGDGFPFHTFMLSACPLCLQGDTASPFFGLSWALGPAWDARTVPQRIGLESKGAPGPWQSKEDGTPEWGQVPACLLSLWGSACWPAPQLGPHPGEALVGTSVKRFAFQ